MEKHLHSVLSATCKITHTLALSAFLALTPFTVSAQEEMSPDSTLEILCQDGENHELKAIIADAERASFNTGICVWDLTTDTKVFDYNGNKIMRPASTQKMCTAVTALDMLGADHEFKTVAYHTGSIDDDGTLTGDIFVVGDFDPMFSLDNLRQLASAVKELGVVRISGRLYADVSMKDNDPYGSGWCWDDAPGAAAPPLCPLMVEGGKEAPHFKKYGKDFNAKPALGFLKALDAELKKVGVLPSSGDGGSFEYGTKDLPNNAGTAFFSTTHTLEQVLQRMMKFSDNLHAESVFYQVAHHTKGRHCSWKDGAKKVNAVLQRAGVNTSQCKVADGSGLSLYNYISPASQVAMLRYAYRHDDIFPFIYNSMSVAGVDGTLSDRMRSGSACENVHAKTGTLEGCITLCGYVTAANGHLLAFSILNNGVLSAPAGRNFQDKVCQRLARLAFGE